MILGIMESTTVSAKPQGPGLKILSGSSRGGWTSGPTTTLLQGCTIRAVNRDLGGPSKELPFGGYSQHKGYRL